MSDKLRETLENAKGWALSGKVPPPSVISIWEAALVAPQVDDPTDWYEVAGQWRNRFDEVSALLADRAALAGAASVGAGDELRRQVELAVIRYKILLGRMIACDLDHVTESHGVSKIEVPGWIDEAAGALGATSKPRE